MRAVQFAEYGSAEVLQLAEVAAPEPLAGQIRIRIEAAGVNPADYKWRMGMFREMVPVRLPHVLGYDVAGTVDAVGPEVAEFVAGDRVFAMLDPVTKGGYAEYVVTEAVQAAHIPNGLDFALAATLPTPALTGMQLIREHVRPKAGETVLVTGAVGAVGRFAIHAAQEVGAKVIAAVRASQLDLALGLGVAEVIVLGETQRLDLRIDHVADTVGGDEVGALCLLVPPGGRIMTVATMPITADGLAATPTFIAVHPDGPGLASIGELVAQGRISVAPARTLPLADAAEAHRLVEAGGLGEKIVLRP